MSLDPDPDPDPDTVARLRDALRATGYGYDAVAALLGPVAHLALGRNETTPGLRVTAGGSPVETLVRLWLLQAAVAEQELDRALPGLVAPLAAAGLVTRSGGEVRAAVDVRPYADEMPSTWSAATETGAPSRPGVRSLTTHQSVPSAA